MTPALNVDKFIEDIKNRPVLWHRDYPKVVKALQEAWTDISICHGIPQRLLKTKWKTLRDTFRVEMKKIPRTDDGEFSIPPQTYQSQWVHYKQMSFLAGQMRLRDPPQEDLSDMVNYNIGYPMEDPDGQTYSIQYDDTTYEDSKELLRQQLEEKPRPMTHSRKPAAKSRASLKKKSRYSAPAATPSRVSSRPKPKPKPKAPSPKPTITTTTSEVAVPSPKHYEEDSQGSGSGSPKDDDYYFLMSLHPYMQQLRHAQKLQARMEIQNIVFKRLYSQGEF